MMEITRRETMKHIGGATATAVSASLSTQAAAFGKSTELGNEFVKAIFTATKTGVRQQYFARDSHGNWVLLVSSFAIPTQRPPGSAPLYGDQGAWQQYRITNCDIFKSVRRIQHEGRDAIELSGTSNHAQTIQIITLDKPDRHFKIVVETTLPGDRPMLEYALSAFQFEPASKPDFTYLPSLKRSADGVSPDRTFHSPAIMLQNDRYFAALVPDLDIINDHLVMAAGVRPHLDDSRPDGAGLPFVAVNDYEKGIFPLILDLDLQSGLTTRPLFAYGFADFITEPHVFWRHENAKGAMTREVSQKKIRHGFDLFLNADAVSFRGYQDLARSHWARYGSRMVRKPRPQAMPLQEYAKICFPAAFSYTGDTGEDLVKIFGIKSRPVGHETQGTPASLPTWIEFESNGLPMGGIRANFAPEKQIICFSTWQNNARDAVGFHWWGKRNDDAGLIEKARRIINLALAAPQTKGMFPGTYFHSEKRWIESFWRFGSDYDKSSQGNTALKENEPSSYQVAAASLTGAHLLRYHRLCEKDARIISYLRKYAEFLLPHTNKGCVPAWFDEHLEPIKALDFNAEGGVHIWFLTELYNATGDDRYLAAAKRMANFLRDEILPNQKWFDFETFFSCSRKPETFKDQWSGQFPQDATSIAWAIHGLSALASATQDADHVSLAEAVGDYSLFFQTSWHPHFVTTAYAFGGFRCQNSDGEFLNGSSNFADALVSLAQITHRQDHYERAVAAMRSSFTLINLPRHLQNGILRSGYYPRGLSVENMDHFGYSSMTVRTLFDWCEGGALMAAAELLRHCGSAFIDAKKGIAVGIDGVQVEHCEISGWDIDLKLNNLLGALPVPWTEPYAMRIRIVNLPEGRYRLRLNDGPPQDADHQDLLDFPLTIAGSAKTAA